MVLYMYITYFSMAQARSDVPAHIQFGVIGQRQQHFRHTQVNIQAFILQLEVPFYKRRVVI